MTGAGRIPLRTLPSGSASLSALALAVDPRGPSPEADRETTEILRRAIAQGVRTFDVSRSRDPPRAERLLRAAAGDSSELSVIILRSAGQLARETGVAGGGARTHGSLAEAVDRSLRPTRDRLPKGTAVLLVWTDDAELDRGSPDLRAEIASLVDVLAVARTVPAAAGPDPLGEGLWIGALSPLDAGVAHRMGGLAEVPGRRLVATDPFSGGRLDGTRIASGLADRTALDEPRSIRDLHAEFDPVLRLGFLTEGRRRTLAQASIQFALSFPWVATVVVPTPRAERLEEYLSAARGPGLGRSELTRVLTGTPE